MKAWTDYPITELGDTEGQKAPVRECEVISYDGDKYCDVIVGGILTSFKCGYLYSAEGRFGEVPRVTYASLARLPDRKINSGDVMTAEKWNAAHRVGTEVLYYPVCKPGVTEAVRTKTQSAAWELANGHAVVMLEGLSGGHSLEHILVVEVSAEGARPEQAMRRSAK